MLRQRGSRRVPERSSRSGVHDRGISPCPRSAPRSQNRRHKPWFSPSSKGDASTAKRYERAQLFVAQVKSAPREQPEVHAEKNVREQRIVQAHMARDSAAIDSRQQDGPENGRARQNIERQTARFDNPDEQAGTLRIS